MIDTLKIVMLLLLYLGACGFSFFESENSEVADGNKAYADQEYPDALSHYDSAAEEQGSLSEIQFNRGSTLYKQGEFGEAMEAYLGALNGADDPLKAKLYYNMGNTLLQQGKLNEAIDSYKRSLRIGPGDRDAIFNLELAQHILEEEKKKQEEQKDKEKQEEGEEGEDQQQGDQQQEEKKEGEEGEQKKDSQEDKQQKEDQQGQKEQEEQKDQASKEQQKEQKGQQDAPQDQQQQEAQAASVQKSEAEHELDKMREDENSFQMQLFMLDQGQPKQMEQDW